MLKTSPGIKVIYTLLGISALGYFLISYFVPREDSFTLLVTYSILFFSYVWLVHSTNDEATINKLLAASLVFRAIFLFSFPMLSDDIYRFVWDGRLLAQGIHPFAELPSFYLEPGNEVIGLTRGLFDKLNSPEYFTIYPPFAQFIFWLSVLVSDNVYGSAIFIRVLVLLAEVGTVYIIIQLLKRYNLSENKVLLYALNPLVIIELTGNLHFEAFMIFFLLMAVYCLHHNAIFKAALFMGASIASKLIPLMLLPLFIRRLKPQVLIRLYSAIGLICLLFFMPLLNYQLIAGMSESVGLYFQKFEFNASIYYLVREVGFIVKGYNIIAIAGKFMAVITFIIIISISLIKSKGTSVFHVMLAILTVYLLMATTVHPWYLTTIIALSVFTKYRFALLWSFLIFFTYVGYSTIGYTENYDVIVVQYLLVGILMIYELYTYAIKSSVLQKS